MVTKLFVHNAVVLIVGVLCLLAVSSADQAKYSCDELGRLVGVVDGCAEGVVSLCRHP